MRQPLLLLPPLRPIQHLRSVLRLVVVVVVVVVVWFQQL
jgi:hypothetical protein